MEDQAQSERGLDCQVGEADLLCVPLRHGGRSAGADSGTTMFACTPVSSPASHVECRIANVEIEGVDSADLNEWLWEEHRILAVAIKHEEFSGIRVSPSVYTTFEELDRFCEAMEHVLAHGLPKKDEK